MVPDDAPTVLWVRDPADPTRFDLWEVDKEYWIEYPFESVLGRPEGLPPRGSAPEPQPPHDLRRVRGDHAAAATRSAGQKYVLDLDGPASSMGVGARPAGYRERPSAP